MVLKESSSRSQSFPPSPIHGKIQTLQTTSDSQLPDLFADTHWSVVLKAQAHGSESSQESRAALEALCQTYWYPLYGYARRRGQAKEDAEDLTQSFFHSWLEKGHYLRADQSRGKFRAFLITAFKNFLINEWKRGAAEKRGGDREILSLDMEGAERQLQATAIEEDPDFAYDRDWATTVFSKSFAELQAEYKRSASKCRLFDEISPWLWPDKAMDRTHAESSRVLDMSEAAVKMAVSRMRDRFRQILREQIAHTVPDAAELDAEYRYLVEILNRQSG